MVGEDHQRPDQPGGPLHVEAEFGQHAPVLEMRERVLTHRPFRGDQLVYQLPRGRELLTLGLLEACDDRRVGVRTAAVVEADGRRMDLVADRTRTVNRLRAQLSGIFPGLERALDLTNKGPLTLLTGYQTPAAIRRLGTNAWGPGSETARSSAPISSPRPRSRPPNASTPACPARS